METVIWLLRLGEAFGAIGAIASLLLDSKDTATILNAHPPQSR
ncbi:MAG TPA: hypothetical protein V6D30_06110 [Leptolyngbyaceae cyanobacterium]